jgi:cardiolipin synthase
VPLYLTALVVFRDVIIVGGAALYQWLIAPIQGEPTLISKLNTTCQLLFIFAALLDAALQWPPLPVLTVLGAAVIFTGITSGLNYVVGWSKRAWRNTHEAVVRILARRS